jgi:hypothetical protein
MIRFYTLFLICISLVSCNKKKDGPPSFEERPKSRISEIYTIVERPFNEKERTEGTVITDGPHGTVEVYLSDDIPGHKWHLRKCPDAAFLKNVVSKVGIDMLGDEIKHTVFHLSCYPPSEMIFDYYQSKKVLRTFKVYVIQQKDVKEGE